jgi:hypothetical protein
MLDSTIFNGFFELKKFRFLNAVQITQKTYLRTLFKTTRPDAMSIDTDFMFFV